MKEGGDNEQSPFNPWLPCLMTHFGPPENYLDATVQLNYPTSNTDYRLIAYIFFKKPTKPKAHKLQTRM